MYSRILERLLKEKTSSGKANRYLKVVDVMLYNQSLFSQNLNKSLRSGRSSRS